jgi:hypothetical protein
MDPRNKTARIAGAIYLSMIFTGPFSLIYIPTKLIVHGNATATAQNVLAHETMFRLGIVADMASAVVFICLGLALYQLFSEVSKPLARLLVAFVLVSAAVGFVSATHNAAALMLFRGGEFLNAFDKVQRDALGMLFLRLDGQATYMNEMFWGLWLLPFGLLVYRSGFLPRFIGGWLVLNCFGYVILSLIALLLPPYYGTAFLVAQPVLFGELAIMFWLLFKGAKAPAPLIGVDCPA